MERSGSPVRGSTEVLRFVNDGLSQLPLTLIVRKRIFFGEHLTERKEHKNDKSK